jgi:hypothetical protein
VWESHERSCRLSSHRSGATGGTEVFFQLDPRESGILRRLKQAIIAPAWPYLEAGGEPVDVTGTWQVHFLEEAW